VELEMQTLAGHRKDAEAFLVVAWNREREIAVRKIFPSTDPMPLDEFFRRLMEIADNCEDAILPYEGRLRSHRAVVPSFKCSCGDSAPQLIQKEMLK